MSMNRGLLLGYTIEDKSVNLKNLNITDFDITFNSQNTLTLYLLPNLENLQFLEQVSNKYLQDLTLWIKSELSSECLINLKTLKFTDHDKLNTYKNNIFEQNSSIDTFSFTFKDYFIWKEPLC